MSIFPVASDSVNLDTAQVETTDVWANGFRMNPVTGGVRAVYGAGSGYVQGIPVDANGCVALVDSSAGLPGDTVFSNGVPMSAAKVCVSSGAMSTYSNGLPMAANGGVGGQLVPSMSLYFLGTAALDSRITFTRADAVTCATYFDSTGRMQTVAANVPRFDYDPAVPNGTTGGELVTNGDFSQGTTGWTVLTNATISNGEITLTGGATAANTVSPVVAGKAYQATYTIKSIDAGGSTARIAIGSTGLGTARNTAGTYTETIYCAGAANVYLYTGGAVVSCVIDNISVKEVIPATTGGELVTNGDFSQGTTGWIASGGVTIANGVCRIVSSGELQVLYTATPNLTVGKTYRIEFDAVVTSGTLFVADDSSGSQYVGTPVCSASGRYSATFTALSVKYQIKRGASCDVTIDNISVKEVTFTPRGLLIEESRQNLLLQSRDMTQAAWTKTDVTPARTQVGIDGVANTACLMTEGSAGTAKCQQNVTVTAGSTLTTSYVLKRGNTDWLHINLEDNATADGAQAWFNLSTGVKGSVIANGGSTNNSSTITSLGGGWYRCTVTSTPNGTITTARSYVFSSSADASGSRVSGATYIVDCAQLEVGSFATSIIQTTTTTRTRAADSASMTGANFSSWFNASAGTFVAEFEKAVYATGFMATASDGTATNRFVIGHNGTNTTFRDARAGVSAAPTDVASSTATVKAAFAYFATGSTGAANGAVGTDGSRASQNITADRLWIGANEGGSGSYANSRIRSLRYYPSRLSNATLQALTT